ncbi:MAG TPA: hypothetical protein VH396_22150 [Chitinophagaceae bacterium]
MKRIILIITIIVVFVATASGEATNTDAAALNIFKVVMNSSGKAEWLHKNDYNKRSVVFNGRTISVYYIAEYSLVGLSYRLNSNDLPKEVLNNIKKRYSKCLIEDALVFMDSDGHIKYYALVKSSKKYTALKISEGLRLSVMKKIPVK